MRQGKTRRGARGGSGKKQRSFYGQPCHYCGRRADTKDHIWPKALGGTNGLWNLVPACFDCNSAKGAAVPTCRCRKCAKATTHGRMIARRAGILVTE